MHRDAQFIGDIFRGEQSASRGCSGSTCHPITPDEGHHVRRHENLFPIGTCKATQTRMRNFHDLRHGYAEQMRDMRCEQKGCVRHGIEMR